MKYLIGFIICLVFISSCDSHDFLLNEKEQTFYVDNLLHFSIEPVDSQSMAYSYDFFWRTKDPEGEVDTICLIKKLSKKFETIESSSFTGEFQYDPSYIKLSPNTQYVVKHTGMGARVNIIKYYHTDSNKRLKSNE